VAGAGALAGVAGVADEVVGDEAELAGEVAGDVAELTVEVTDEAVEPAEDVAGEAVELADVAEVADDVAELTVEVTGDVAELTVEVTGDVAELTVEVTGDVAELTEEVTGDVAEATVEVTGDVADPSVDEAPESVEASVVLRGDRAAVAAWAGRENSSMTTKMPAVASAACTATRAMRRAVGCMSSSHSTRNQAARLPSGGGANLAHTRNYCSVTTVQSDRRSGKGGGSRQRARTGRDRLLDRQSRARTFVLLSAELSCLRDVEVHLLDQGLDRVEAEGAAQPGSEVDRRVDPV
jgi:hypothetical protein